MRKRIYRLFWVWDFDKEEAWLNRMAAQGLALVSPGLGSYVFEESLPGEYQFRLELLDQWPSHAKSQAYIRFLEETGVEYLGSVLRWAYFRRKSQEEAFELYSDFSSRRAHLQRLLLLLGILALSQFISGLSQFMIFRGEGRTVSLMIAGLCWSLALLLAYGTFKVWRKKKALERDHQLFE